MPPSDVAPDNQRRPRNRRGEGDQLRTEVLRAVAELLDEQVRRPDLNLSLREVARATGIAAQSLYIHFSSKEALAWQAAADGYERLVVLMRAADHAAPPHPGDRLRAQAHAFVDFALANRGLFRLMFGHDVGRLDPSGTDHPGVQLWDQWVGAVRACEQADHEFPEGVEQVATHVWSSLLGRVGLAVTTFSRDDTGTVPDYVDYVIDQVLNREDRRA